MKRRAFAATVAALAGCLTTFGADLSLEFRTVPPEKIATFAGGFGGSGSITAQRGSQVRKQPPVVSKNALYGSISGPQGQVLCRVDESKGTGQGYDRLILDVNHNGDLADDGVAPRIGTPAGPKTPSNQQIWFGPIQGPADKLVAGHRIVLYALLNIYVRPASDSGSSELYRLSSAGYVRLKSGWYLETETEVDGKKQKIGVYDSDTDGQLWQPWTASTYTSSGEKNWFFRARDSFLVDADGSGAFEADPFNTEAYPYGSILALGKTANKVTLNADCKSLRLEPWSEPLAEVAIQPRGDQVESVSLALERPNDKWDLFRAPVIDSKVRVPAGNYRLYSCVVQGGLGTDDQIRLSGVQRKPATPVAFAAGKENTLRCGAPLDLKIKAEKRRAQSYELSRGGTGDPQLQSDSVVSINGNIIGAGGEIYSTFGAGRDFKSDPPKPAFTIADANGRRVYNGNLEFG